MKNHKKIKHLSSFLSLMFKRAMFVLLGLILVYLFVKSLQTEKNNVTYEVVESNDVQFIYDNVKEEGLSHEEDLSFITEALKIDESKDYTPYTIADLIERDVSLEVHPDQIYNSKIYELYEEDLPEEIAEEKADIIPSENGKHVRDIDVNSPHKPPYFGEKPVIAIVIDDMGISHKRTKDISSLHAPITASFLTYSSALNKQVHNSIEAGHEIIIHVPMEAKKKTDVAPDVLTTTMNKEEIQLRLRKMLDKFSNVKGINNHMGSLFTEDKERMGYIMEVLKEHELFFLDSKTSAQTVGKSVAQEADVDYVGRNIFLDNNNDFDYITGQLEATEKVAHKNGYAVAIGHPKSQTYLALKEWLKTLEEKNIEVVHLSKIVKVLN